VTDEEVEAKALRKAERQAKRERKAERVEGVPPADQAPPAKRIKSAVAAPTAGAELEEALLYADCRTAPGEPQMMISPRCGCHLSSSFSPRHLFDFLAMFTHQRYYRARQAQRGARRCAPLLGSGLTTLR
jgi:hypothetical protein